MSTKRPEGFTLIEVLIAIAILAIVMSIVYGSFVQTRKVIGATESAVEGDREIRAAFRMITTDLAMAFLSTHKPEYTVFIGTDGYENGHAMDSLDFSTFSHRPRHADTPESDQAVVGYYLRRGLDETSVLMRRNKRQMNEVPLDGGKSSEVASGILGLDLRYLDEDEAWLESWDSRGGKANSDKIPQAVEVTLLTWDSLGQEHPFRTVIELPLGAR